MGAACLAGSRSCCSEGPGVDVLHRTKNTRMFDLILSSSARGDFSKTNLTHDIEQYSVISSY
jgi:hypothetical protein